MKNFFLSIIIIALLSAVLQLFLSWWIIAIAAFTVGYALEQKPYAAFFSGFIAVFLLWSVYAWFLSHSNADALAHKVALLLPLKGNVLLLLLITGLIYPNN